MYEAIADGMPIDASVAEARKAVRLSARNSVEWGTPVLHMRSPDGALFNLDTSRFAARPKSEAAPVPPAPSVSARSPVETGQDWRDSNIESLLPADDMTRIMTDPHYQSTQDLFGYMSTPGNGWYSNNEGPGRAKESLREYMAAMDTAR